MKICPSCQATQVADSAAACLECGASLASVEPVPTTDPSNAFGFKPALPHDAANAPTPASKPDPLTPSVGLGGLYTVPLASKKKGKFSETLWFKEGDELKEDDLDDEISPERYLRENPNATPEDVRKRFSLNPDKKATDEDILP